MPFDDCAFHATELFAMATSPLSIDVWLSDQSRCEIELSCVPLDLPLLSPSSSPRSSEASRDCGMRNLPRECLA
ncbi:hypothetical protein GMDG_08545 [Pseudogymnoascus destructans 20631-21]|uniref:Uncharacterized protein n=1 Tax=Pseudogymnoascus destructans (strain ATCC MYA-4855 / 20631-21) TaxID=658429 RepID=L8G511_PSED2|nr:hypothetical protein GMDG_08545 [Pseudogymnoascus destructans 20631-21]